MDFLSKTYARRLFIYLRNEELDSQFTYEDILLLENELIEIYNKVIEDVDLENYVHKQILQYTCNGYYKQYNLRSNKDNYNKLIKLSNNIYKILKNENINHDLIKEILGYIHLKNSKFYNEKLTDLNYELAGSINNINCLSIDENNFNPKEFDIADSTSINFSVNRNGSNFSYCLYFYKIDPLDYLCYSMIDDNYMYNTINNYTPHNIYLNLKIEEQNAIKNFINTQKLYENYTDCFQSLIPKDIVNIIDHFNYPQLDSKTLINNILDEIEEEYNTFINKINTDKVEVKDQMILYHKYKSQILDTLVKFIKYIPVIKNLDKNNNFKKEIMKAVSFIFMLLKSNIGKMITESHERFMQVIRKKKIEFLKQAQIWADEGEDVDSFVEIIS